MTRNLLRAGLALVVVILVVLAALNRATFNQAVLDQFFSNLGPWAYAVFIALYAFATVIFLPGSAFALIGGALYGPVWGTVLNLLGANIGADIAFLTARYIAGDAVSRKTQGRLKQFISGVENEGWRFVAFVRLAPIFPFNLTNYALGLTRIGFVPYAVTSFLCMIPGAVAYSWLGYAGRGAITGDSSTIRYGLLALGLLAAIAFLPRLVKRLRRPQQSEVGWVEAQALNDMLARGTNPVIVDVRGPEEFAGSLGHLSGAINIPVAELQLRLSEIDDRRNEPLFLVCKTDRRSASAAVILANAEFMQVHVLRGGMEQWNLQGLPVNRF